MNRLPYLRFRLVEMAVPERFSYGLTRYAQPHGVIGGHVIAGGWHFGVIWKRPDPGFRW